LTIALGDDPTVLCCSGAIESALEPSKLLEIVLDVHSDRPCVDSNGRIPSVRLRDLAVMAKTLAQGDEQPLSRGDKTPTTERVTGEDRAPADARHALRATALMAAGNAPELSCQLPSAQ